MPRPTVLLCGLFLLVFAHRTSADDWPQWLGQRRDSVWREEGLVERIPAKGLAIRWRAPVSNGYAGPAVAAGRVYLADFVAPALALRDTPGAPEKIEGHERLLCFDQQTGRLLWKQQYPCTYEIDYPNGPRATPTVSGELVYMLGAEGDLKCFQAASGEPVWSKNFRADYGAKTPLWGYAGHPLADERRLYCVVGGEGSIAVALDKRTGRELWRSLSASAQGYCPPTMIEHGGRRQLLIWNADSLNSLEPETGKVLWTVALQPDFEMSIAAPRLAGDYLFASGIGDVGVLLKLKSDPPAADVVWRGAPQMALYSSNATPLVTGDTIYAVNCRSGALTASRLADGKLLWESFKPTTGNRRAPHGTAFIVRQADRFWLMSETGDIVLANLTPAGYDELGRFRLLEPTSRAFGRSVVWSHPAFAGRCIFARNDKELVCAEAGNQ